jgi:hypothetical protein
LALPQKFLMTECDHPGPVAFFLLHWEGEDTHNLSSPFLFSPWGGPLHGLEGYRGPRSAQLGGALLEKGVLPHGLQSSGGRAEREAPGSHSSLDRCTHGFPHAHWAHRHSPHLKAVLAPVGLASIPLSLSCALDVGPIPVPICSPGATGANCPIISVGRHAT